MFENNDLILIVTYIATGWPKKMPHFIWKKLEAFRIQKLLICKVSKFDGRFLGHPVAIYVTIRIRSLFSNILNHLKQLLWESLSSFSEIPIFPKKIPLLGTKKLSTLYLETTHLFGIKLWLQEVLMGAEVSSLTGSA